MSIPHPLIAKVIESSQNTPSQRLTDMTITEARATLNPIFTSLAEPPGPIGHVSEITIPAKDANISVRLYYPDAERALSPTKPFLPIVVYIHGGGWTLGTLDTHDSVCRALAMEAGVIIASIDYRLAPEHPFPTPLQDCYDALCWLAENAHSIKADGSKLIIVGDSAGGNLANSCCFMALDHNGPTIDYQVLIYPVIDITRFDRDSYKRYDEQFILKRSSMHAVSYCYAKTEERINPYISPILREELSGLPDTLLLAAELDILFDEGKEYAERLKQAGVSTEWINCKGMIHLFWGMKGLTREENGIAIVADRIRKRLFKGN